MNFTKEKPGTLQLLAAVRDNHDRALKGAPLILLVMLISRTNVVDYTCFPSYATLSLDTCGLTELTLRRAARYLEESGYITRKQRSASSSNTFTLIVTKIMEAADYWRGKKAARKVGAEAERAERATRARATARSPRVQDDTHEPISAADRTTKSLNSLGFLCQEHCGEDLACFSEPWLLNSLREALLACLNLEGDPRRTWDVISYGFRFMKARHPQDFDDMISTPDLGGQIWSAYPNWREILPDTTDTPY